MSESSCAACGKADAGLSCTAGKSIKYCNVNVDCQNVHQSKQEKDCERAAAELFDQKLFAEPPAREDCDICFLRLPLTNDEVNYMTCCGKYICIGCLICVTSASRQCPFCRTPAGNDKEKLLDRIKKFNDPMAMFILGHSYHHGLAGLPVNQTKAAELFRQASELGLAEGHYSLGSSYLSGKGLEMDKKKAIHHFQIAAMKGHHTSRYIVGRSEYDEGNIERAMKHYMIAAKSGDDESLKEIKKGFMAANVTKEEFELALRCHQASRGETKSEQRDRAKAFFENNYDRILADAHPDAFIV